MRAWVPGARRALAGIALLVAASVRASHPAIRNYSAKDGLPQAQVTALLQDRMGYLWIGTNAGGVGRYDGNRWDVFDASSGLPGNSVIDLALDESGAVWAATNGGISRWSGGVWSLVSKEASVRDICSAGGRIWIGTPRGLSVWNPASKAFAPVPLASSFAAAEVSVLADDGEDRLYVGTTAGLGMLESNGALVQPVAGAPAGQITVILARPHLPLLFAEHDRGLFELENGVARRVGDDRVPGNRVSYLQAASREPGVVWIGTGNRGAFRLHQGRYERFSTSEGLLDDHVYSILEDREGIVWFGTDGGLTKRVPSSFVTLDSGEGFSKNDAVYSMAESTDHSLWFSASEGGLIRLAQDGSFRRFTKADGLPDSRVSEVVANPRGGVWAGTRRGLAIVAGERARPVSLPKKLSEDIRLLRASPDGSLLIGSFSEGLFSWDGTSLREVAGPLGKSITSLFWGGNGTLWCGGDGWGVVALRKGAAPEVFDRARGLPSNQVTGVFEDSAGSVWISTDRGAWTRSPGGQTRVYDRESGLPDSYVYWVGEDRQHAIWIGTNRGVVRMPSPGVLHVYTSKDGLGADECNEEGFLVDSRGRVYVANLGVSVFTGPSTSLQGALPNVEIGALVAGQSDLPVRDGYRFPHDSGPITFRFVGLSFVDEGSMRFRYRLRGLSPDWRETRFGEHETTYGGLGPGDYLFELEALTGDGRRSQMPRRLSFTIVPLWWQTKWARVAAGAVLLILVWQIVRFVEWRSRAARRRLESQVAQRTEELRKANERLADLAVTDELTALANRRHILDRLTEAFAYARRHETHLSIAMADFDHFKDINDAFGHAAGDLYLARASRAMQSVLREVDVIGRYGGEEFLVVLPGSPLDGALAVAERIRASVEDLALDHAAEAFPEGHSTISIGVACLDGSLADSAELLRRADLALYRAKAEGRNRVRILEKGETAASLLPH